MARLVVSQIECEQPKRRMENIIETSEASAEPTDAETNTNANLSVDDLAASFVEKVEAEAEDQSTPEATEESTSENAPRVELTPQALLEFIPKGESITKADWYSKAKLQGVSENRFEHLLSMIRQSGMVNQTKKEGTIYFERNAGL